MLNVLIGVLFAESLFKNAAFTGLAGGLFGVGVACCLIYVIVKYSTRGGKAAEEKARMSEI